MAVYLSNELGGSANQTTVPAGYKPSAVNGVAARVRRYRGTVTLASQTTSDTIVVGVIPAGDDFAYGVITSSVSLGASLIAVGITGNAGKYRAATVLTAVDTPTLFGPAAQVLAPALTAEEQISVSIITASLPASGNIVIDLYFTRP